MARNNNTDTFTTEETSQFKSFFSRYCRAMINGGKCQADDCEFCSVNTAYDQIFNAADDASEATEAED